MPRLALVKSSARRAPNCDGAERSPTKDGNLPAISAAPNELDRSFRALVARYTGGVSPAAAGSAFFDWAVHLAASPGRQLELVNHALEGALVNIDFALQCALGCKDSPCDLASPNDDRFRAEDWTTFPYNVCAHSFLSVERWWEMAASGVRGVSKRHADVVTFAARQLLDTVAPSNFVLTNPQVLARTRHEKGMNLARGWSNMADDFLRTVRGLPPAGTEAYRAGETVAVTRGKVVRRTRLAEIIQYAPTTEQVRPEPIVIVPAWIMKYYILDLSPTNSLVRFLVDQGYTVFMVSWKNPGPADREWSLDDYRMEGVVSAIDTAIAITAAKQVHAVGYCLGGTLLAITAAAMARDCDDRLRTLSFFAAQTDFTEAGELMLFIDESQVALLEDMMWDQGYLAAEQMASAFQLLRSNDLIWSRIVRDYLMGERSGMIDIMAWNADTTRMPYRMHSQYLRSLFLDNALAAGRFDVDGWPVALPNIRVPIFAVGTEQDHVAPWRSVYKFHLLSDAEITFALTNGGHNAGVLSEPGHRRRRYRLATKAQDQHYIDADTWYATNAPCDGSWWTAWHAWLARHSGALVEPPPLGNPEAGLPPLADAPGEYVLTQ
jgi:polyhydroxyalkanoate synthase subunit PhaC